MQNPEIQIYIKYCSNFIILYFSYFYGAQDKGSAKFTINICPYISAPSFLQFDTLDLVLGLSRPSFSYFEEDESMNAATYYFL